MTISTDSETLVSVSNPEHVASPRQSRFASVSAQSATPTYVGAVLVVLGFVALIITWVKVAAETVVAAQLPYFASGGFIGLALVMVGLTTVSVAAKLRDSQLRAQQVELLVDALDELRRGRGRN